MCSCVRFYFQLKCTGAPPEWFLVMLIVCGSLRGMFRVCVCVCIVAGHTIPCSIVHSMISNMCSRCTVRTETAIFFLYWLRFRSRQDLPVIFSGLLLAPKFVEVKDIWCNFFRSCRQQNIHDIDLEYRNDNNGRMHSARSHTPKGSTSRAKLFHTMLDVETFQALYQKCANVVFADSAPDAVYCILLLFHSDFCCEPISLQFTLRCLSGFQSFPLPASMATYEHVYAAHCTIFYQFKYLHLHHYLRMKS